MKLLDRTYHLLDECPLSLEKIANGAGVGYWWLTKLKQRRFEDPGVGRIERLHEFLSDQAANSDSQPTQAA